MHRLIQRFGAPVRIRCAKAGRGQHAEAAGQHCCAVRQDIAKQVVSEDDIKLLGLPYQLHCTVICVHVAEFYIRIIGVAHSLHNFAPQNARLHDIGLLHGADFVVAATCKLKGRAGNAVNFGFCIALRVDTDTLIALFKDAPWLSEIDAAGQFAHDHDVEPRNDVLFQGREIRERIKTLGWAQVGKKVHLFAQAQKPAFRFDGEVEVIIFGPTHSTQQHRVGGQCLGHGVIMQRRAVRVIGRPADEILFNIKGQTALCAIPVDDPCHLAHDLGSNAVSGEDKQGWVGHVNSPETTVSGGLARVVGRVKNR